MNRKLLTLCAALLAAAALTVTLVPGGAAHTLRHPSPPRADAAASARPATQATNRLALKLLTGLGTTGNVVFSPYSIQAALAMVDQGAAESTATQIGHVLGSQNSAALGAAEALLATDLKGSTSVPTHAPADVISHLLIANGLWVQSGLSLETPFQNALAQEFGAAPQMLAFGSAPDAARQAINNWVAGHTEQLIKNLMPPGSISTQTALVLANAIYLKAHWADPFVKSQTANAPFFTATGQSVSVPFMTQPSFQAQYGSGPGYRAIDLGYADSTLSMLAVMPSQNTLSSFQAELTPAGLGRIVDSLAIHNVDLRMPRVQLNLHVSLNDELEALGMPAAFSDGADFSRITHSTSLKIHDVEHAAVMKVDEAGTVAAAATGVSLVPTAVLGGPSIALTLDHPYLLFLRDDRTGAILFAARVANPSLG